jgi:hypothetical protein
MCHLVLPRDSKRHPLNSADGSAVRNTKRYTLAHHVATATTLITIRGIRRHGKLKNSDYGLLAQFGLTPKSRRGLAESEVVDEMCCVVLCCDRLAKDQPAETTIVQISEVKESISEALPTRV